MGVKKIIIKIYLTQKEFKHQNNSCSVARKTDLKSALLVLTFFERQSRPSQPVGLVGFILATPAGTTLSQLMEPTLPPAAWGRHVSSLRTSVRASLKSLECILSDPLTPHMLRILVDLQNLDLLLVDIVCEALQKLKKIVTNNGFNPRIYIKNPCISKRYHWKGSYENNIPQIFRHISAYLSTWENKIWRFQRQKFCPKLYRKPIKD